MTHEGKTGENPNHVSLAVSFTFAQYIARRRLRATANNDLRMCSESHPPAFTYLQHVILVQPALQAAERRAHTWAQPKFKQ